MNTSQSNAIAASTYPMPGRFLLFLLATLIAAPAGAITTSSKRYAVYEINFDHTNATAWGGTNAGPYKELDCRAELTTAPSDAAQATSIVPRRSGGNNTFKIPLFYDGIVTVGGTNKYRWKLRIAGNTAGTYRYKVVCDCSLIATGSHCATKPSFHSAAIEHIHTINNATTSEMDNFTWEGRGWLTTDGARFFRYDRKDMTGNPDNRTILNGIFSAGIPGLSQQSKSEKRSIGYEEPHVDTLASAAAQSNFNAIVLEVYRGWADNPAIVNKDANGNQNAAANLEGYLCKTPQTCGGGLTDCNCPDKLHPFENKGSDKARIVPAYWQSMDVRLKKLVLATTSGRKSLTAAIKFGQNTCVGGTQGFGNSSGLPRNNYKHFLLYLIGRYGAYNVLWMGHQEADELGCHSTGYISAYLDWMHTNDPYFRPTSNHKLPHTAAPAFNAYTNHDAWSTGPISPRFLGVQETDSFGSAGNLDEAGPDDTAAWDHARSASWGTNIPGLSSNPKPWVNMEYGFERRASDDDRNQADQVDLDLLEDIWGAMLGRAAGMFYGSPWIKPGNRSSVDTGRLNDPGFKYYHPNLYKFFHDANANVRYWEWNAFKKVPVGATAYTLSCKQNDSCVLNFLETTNQNVNMTATGKDNPAFASGSTVHLRWYDVRRGCWKDTGTRSFIAGPASNVTRPSNPTGGSDRWVAILRKGTPYGTLSAPCPDL